MSSSSPHARHLLVQGRVQGVFFRASTRDRARDAGVVGWVRNLPDGRVEAHLEGSPDAVEQVEAWVRDGGPRDAVVEQVQAEDVAPEHAEDFTIVR